MNRTKLPISSIINENRQRFELGDVESLAESIKTYGLIQPIVINQNNVLIAGGRRLAAHALLGLCEVEVVYKETLDTEYLKELEAEENLKRKDFTWQERTLAIAELHQMRSHRAAINGTPWGQRETAALMGVKSVSTVNYAVTIADFLSKEKLLPEPERRFWSCENFSDAWKLRMRLEQDAALAELARRQGARNRPAFAQNSLAIESLLEDSPAIAGDLLSPLKSSPSPTGFITGYAPEIPPDDQRVFCPVCYGENFNHCDNCLKTGYGWKDGHQMGMRPVYEEYKPEQIVLSDKLFNVDCITFMQQNLNKFDHIITDPPYGIDMEMLSQTNQGMEDIDTVAKEHTIKGNDELLTNFIPAAYSCLKDNGFLVFWCDQDNWEWLKQLCLTSGFKVQRWPITWVKQHKCINQSAQYNFTKSTEIAMVCRKGSATLINPASTSHILAPHDDYKTTLGHPFVKPFDVWNYIIKHISMEGQSILEPFAGRGSGVISLLRTNRNVTCCESNMEHYNALLNNVQNHYLKINPKFTFA